MASTSESLWTYDVKVAFLCLSSIRAHRKTNDPLLPPGKVELADQSRNNLDEKEKLTLTLEDECVDSIDFENRGLKFEYRGAIGKRGNVCGYYTGKESAVDRKRKFYELQVSCDRETLEQAFVKATLGTLTERDLKKILPVFDHT